MDSLLCDLEAYFCATRFRSIFLLVAARFYGVENILIKLKLLKIVGNRVLYIHVHNLKSKQGFM